MKFKNFKIEVVFEDGEEEPTAEREQARIATGKERKSKLTAYFKLNMKLPDAERKKYTYATISQAYWYDKEHSIWLKRKNKCNKLVRIGSAAPGNIELQVNIIRNTFKMHFLYY